MFVALALAALNTVRVHALSFMTAIIAGWLALSGLLLGAAWAIRQQKTPRPYGRGVQS